MIKKKKTMLEPAIAYKPFHYEWASQYSLDSEKAHWGEWEAELSEDVNQWKGNDLTTSEKEHITQILRLFTQSDVIVAGNYSDIFIPAFKNHEIRQMLLSFACREVVHSRAYALLNDTLGLHHSEYSKFLEYEEMVAKVEFMQNYDSKTRGGLGLALAQTVCNEGLSLFSAFAMLLNYQRFGKMKGMCSIVEWSIRDENLHVMGMSELFKEYCREHPRIVTDDFKSKIYEMFTTAVELEDKVIDLAYAMGPVEGLSADEVKLYIRYMADQRLRQIGMKEVFNVEKNPLEWVDWVTTGASHTNFFEARVTDYSKDNLSGDWGW